MNDLELLKNELTAYLIEGKIDEKYLNRKIFELIKNCIKNKVNEIRLGNYFVNLNPSDLKVTYESESTYLEYSNVDIYEEYEIIDNIQYYIIRNAENDYNEKSPVIKVTNSIIKSSPNYSENLTFELQNAIDDTIVKYLKENDDLEIENNNFAKVDKYFNPEDNRLNEEKYLDLSRVMLVCKQLDGTYKPTYREEKAKYVDILPNLDNNKKIVSQIYNTILNFYKEFI